jgi:hypothetical protein
MIRLKVVVKPRGPLVLGRGMNNQNVRESHDYIAGSVVRGTLAQVILESLKQHSTSRRSVNLVSDPHHRTIFDAVFTTPSAARFGYLYPTYLQTNEKTHDAFTLESFPAPVTTLACKPHRTDHPVLDALQTTIRRGARLQACIECQERIERWRGFVIRRADGTPDWCKGALRRPLVRVGLNRWTEAAEERILYVLDAIMSSGEQDKPLAFVGFWTMSKQQWSHLKLLLDCFYPREQNGYRLRLGSARARGLGEVVLWYQQEPFADLAVIPALKISIKYQCIRYEKREAFRNSTKEGKLQAS